jgi:3-hydroxymyristoyl/3-hydroxydecanoyl-(acyl carrier protein) dehydratase
MSPLRREIDAMLGCTARPGGFAAELKVRHDLAIFADHFPDNPILPGICLVQAVLLAGERHVNGERQSNGERQINGEHARNGRPLRITELKNIKFMAPVRPGAVVAIDGKVSTGEGGDIAIKARLSIEDRRCAEIYLVARSAEGES